MLIIISSVIALIPMLLYLFIIWNFDQYEKQPISLVSLNFFWGAIGAVFLSYIGTNYFLKFISLFIEGRQLLSYAQSFFAAPIVEEIVKGTFLFFTLLSMKYDNLTDGIIYGGAIGLGFGMTENFLYFITYSNSLSQWLTIVIIRTLFSAFMHGVATATLGAMLGYSKFKPLPTKIFYILFGIAISIFIHFAWNFTISFSSTAILGFLFIIFILAIFIVIFSISLKREKEIISTELIEEVENGTIPLKYFNILKSKESIKSAGVDEKIGKIYSKNAIILAFRKFQLKNSKEGKSKNFYTNEVNNYRELLKNLMLEKI